MAQPAIVVSAGATAPAATSAPTVQPAVAVSEGATAQTPPAPPATSSAPTVQSAVTVSEGATAQSAPTAAAVPGAPTVQPAVVIPAGVKAQTPPAPPAASSAPTVQPAVTHPAGANPQPPEAPAATTLPEPPSLFGKTGYLPPAALRLDPRVHLEVPAGLKRPDIAIYVTGVEEPLIVPLTKDLMLGRFAGLESETPANIDLAPFGAMENGVSRKHALLRRLGPDVVVIDLGSTNGTWLNGVPLKPHQPVTLRSGDRLVVARLVLQVFVP